VISLVTRQILLERRRNKQLQRLHKEILDYAKLKEEWGIGHIKIVIHPCRFSCCREKKEKKFEYFKIYGCYIDIDDKPQKTYLADSYKHAKRRAYVEKTFIYPVSEYYTKYAHNRWLKQNRTNSLTEPLD